MQQVQQRCQRRNGCCGLAIRALELWEITVLSPLFYGNMLTTNFAGRKERMEVFFEGAMSVFALLHRSLYHRARGYSQTKTKLYTQRCW